MGDAPGALGFSELLAQTRNKEELRKMLHDNVVAAITREARQRVPGIPIAEASAGNYSLFLTTIARRSFELFLSISSTAGLDSAPAAAAQPVAIQADDGGRLQQLLMLWLLLHTVSAAAVDSTTDRTPPEEGHGVSVKINVPLLPVRQLTTGDGGAADAIGPPLIAYDPLAGTSGGRPVTPDVAQTHAESQSTAPCRQVTALDLVLPWFTAHDLFLLQRCESYLNPNKRDPDATLMRLSSMIAEKITGSLDSRNVCPICQDDFTGGRGLACLVPECGHAVHAACFARMVSIVPESRSGHCRLCTQTICFGRTELVIANLCDSLTAHMAEPLKQMLASEPGRGDRVPEDQVGVQMEAEAENSESMRDVVEDLIEGLSLRLESEINSPFANRSKLTQLFRKHLER